MPFPRIAIAFDAAVSADMAASLALEAEALAAHGPVSVVPVLTPAKKTASKRPMPKPHVTEAFAARDIPLVTAPYVVTADTILWHDPGAMRTRLALKTRYVAKRFVVITDTDFALPNGVPLFDAEECMGVLDAQVLAGERHLIPVSDHNRHSLMPWHRGAGAEWALSGDTWPLVMERDCLAPIQKPADRRGWIFGPTRQHFPDRRTLAQLYPAQSAFCGVMAREEFLGAAPPDHWAISRPGGMTETRFLRDIDFALAFANPNWRGHENHAIATAIAAGKPVIADPIRAAHFGPGIIAATPDQVDDIIAGLIADPERYKAAVATAQAALARYSKDAFTSRSAPILRAIGAI